MTLGAIFMLRRRFIVERLAVYHRPINIFTSQLFIRHTQGQNAKLIQQIVCFVN